MSGNLYCSILFAMKQTAQFSEDKMLLNLEKKFIALSAIPLLLVFLGCSRYHLLGESLPFKVIAITSVAIFVVHLFFFGSFISSTILVVGSWCSLQSLFFIALVTGYDDVFQAEDILTPLLAACGLFFNVLIIKEVYDNKKPDQYRSLKAANTALKTLCKPILLTSAIAVIILSIQWIMNLKSTEINFLYAGLGLLTVSITSLMLVPPLCSWLLGHINSQYLPYEKATKLEVLTHRIDINIEDFAAKLVWLSEPVLKSRYLKIFITLFCLFMCCWLLSVISTQVVTDTLMPFNEYGMMDNSLPLFQYLPATMVVWCLLTVIVYKDYILSIAATISIASASAIISFIIQQTDLGNTAMQLLFTGSIIISTIVTVLFLDYCKDLKCHDKEYNFIVWPLIKMFKNSVLSTVSVLSFFICYMLINSSVKIYDTVVITFIMIITVLLSIIIFALLLRVFFPVYHSSQLPGEKIRSIYK